MIGGAHWAEVAEEHLRTGPGTETK
jgi:hypothetical protein